MKKLYLMNGLAVAAMSLAMVGCQRMSITPDPNYNAKAFEENFQNTILNGNAIDPDQTWSTAVNSDIKVSVDLNYGETYTVYITESNPLTDSEAAYLGQATVQSGSSTTFTIARPSATGGYFAALYDKNGHATVKPFAIENGTTEISFGETAANKVATRAASTGNRWSVTTLNMPNLDKYTTGNLIEMQESFNTNGTDEVSQADGKETHLKITGTYTGSIARIQSYADQSVYVTGTWNVPEDQRVTGGSVVVVGPTGVINVPANHMLSTNANNNAGTTGMIYVQPGGKITGDGQLQFSNGTETYSYNAGVITVKDININGGTFYNAGTIGGVEGENNPALTGPAGTPDQPSRFINMGHAKLASVGGAGISIENGCNLTVVGNMTLGKSSKLDGGSYVEVGSLTLGGSNDGDITLYMGPAAYLKIREGGDFDVNNFGVWGPTSGSNAIFEISTEVSQCVFTQNLPGTQMLDHVELIIPEDYPAEITNNGYGCNAAGEVIYGWFNGLNYTTINPDAFVWEQNYDKYGDYKNHNTNVANLNGWPYTNNSKVTDDRRTCVLGTSPSYTVEADEEGCSNGFTSKENKQLKKSYIYFAFEDLGAADDFDFNDVVVRVSSPDESGKADVELCAAGGTLETYVYNGSTQLGDEVHALFGCNYGTYNVPNEGNTNSTRGSSSFVSLGQVNVPTGTTVQDLDIRIRVTRSTGVIAEISGPKSTGETPFRIVVAGDANGKWFWPLERKNISDAYTSFGEWGANYSAAGNWSATYTDGLVVKW